MKKLSAFFVVLLLLFALLAGCGYSGQHFGQPIEDVNGPDDFTLCSVTEEDICRSKSHIALASVTSTIGGKTEIRIGELSGVLQPDASLASVRANGETLVWHAVSSVTAGNLRICIVRDNEEIVGDLPINNEGEVRIENAQKGRYTLRIAGESAAFSLEITLEKG